MSTADGMNPGPPFKALDNYFNVNMQPTPDVHIYLYNKKALASNFRPASIILRPDAPYEIESIGDVPSSSAYILESPNLSPLLKILPEYERRFLTQYHEGIALSKYISDLLVSARKSLHQYQVQQSALEAVISNLSDHYKSVSSAFNNVQSKIIVQLQERKQVLDNYDSNLEALGRQYIHQALVPHAEKFLNADSSATSTSLPSSKAIGADTTTTVSAIGSIVSENALALSISQNIGEANTSNESSTNNTNNIATDLVHTTQKLSLLECLSLEKEKIWKSKCEEASLATEQGLKELKESYSDVQTGVNTVDTDQSIVISNNNSQRLQNFIDLIEEENSQQIVDMDQLKASHVSSFDELDRVVALLRSEGNDDEKGTLDEGLRKLVDNFEQQFKMHQDVLLPAMQKRVERCTKFREDILSIRTAFTEHMYKSFKKSGEEQTKIHKLKRRIEMMAKLYRGQNEYFRHLKGVSNLSAVYDAFIVEILRRKEFSSMYADKIDTSLNEITSLRKEETVKREKFIRKYGNDIPAVLMNIVPSIREKPPYLTTSLTAEQWLPDIDMSDLSPTQSTRLNRIKESLGSSEERSGSRNSDNNINMKHDEDVSPQGNDDVIEGLDDSSHKDPSVEALQHENRVLKRELEELRAKMSTYDTKNNSSQGHPSSPLHQSRSESELLFASLLSTLSSITAMVETNPTNIVVPTANVDTTDMNFGNAAMEMVQYYVDAVDTQFHEMNEEICKLRSIVRENQRDAVSPTNQNALSKETEACFNSSFRDQQKISFRSFEIGDIALFCPVNSSKDAYVAFNLACPCRYLSPDSLRSFREEVKDGKKVHRNIDVYVLGRIVKIQEGIASDENRPVSNPFNISEGTVYYLIDAVAIDKENVTVSNDSGSSGGGGRHFIKKNVG